jgi:cytidylate kinase
MNTAMSMDRCLTFINCQMQGGAKPPLAPGVVERKRAVTISRQTGSGAHRIAEELAVLLQKLVPGPGREWTVFDRNLVEKVLEDHHLPQRLAQFMNEDRVWEVSDTLDELFGLHPQSWTLVRQTADTIFRLADLGNAILIGRGANLVTARLPGMTHVRLIAGYEKRLAYVQEHRNLGRKAAEDYIQAEDKGRKRYLRKYFGKDVDDPSLYHLVLNTDLVGHKEAARIIAELVVGPRLAPVSQHKRALEPSLA